jgi:hypothetical protein
VTARDISLFFGKYGFKLPHLPRSTSPCRRSKPGAGKGKTQFKKEEN